MLAFSLALSCLAQKLPPVLSELPPPDYPVDPLFTGEILIEGAEMQYYTVVGDDEFALLKALRQSGPLASGSPHAAVTTATVGWEATGDGETCRIIAVSEAITVIFPRWVAAGSAPARTAGNWQRYVAALARHEQGHVELIRARVAEMPSLLAGSCAGVDDRGRAALASIAAAGAAYDVSTESGATQGALLFPPRTP